MSIDQIALFYYDCITSIATLCNKSKITSSPMSFPIYKIVPALLNFRLLTVPGRVLKFRA